MGLFSDEKKTYVGTTVTRVITDTLLPNAIKTGVIKSIFDDGSIPEYAMEELIGSIGVRADRMYEYGRTTYTYGLPSGQFKTSTEGLSEVTAVLSVIEDAPVLPLYCHYGPPNKLHIGWLKVIADHGYNPTSNQLAALSATKGTPVYLDNLTVVVPAAALASYNPGALAQWGTPATAGYTPERPYQGLTGQLLAATPVTTDPVASDAYIRVDYVWQEIILDALEVRKSSFTIPLTGYDNAVDYFHVKYTVGGITKYWVYQDNLGTYPTLDAVFFVGPQTNGTFFPFGYFRYNKVSGIADTTTTAYAHSKKLVKYLGLDYDSVTTSINDNPDIADVEQAMLMMAVPANTTNEIERRYLFAFFDGMFYADGNQFTSTAQANITRILQGQPNNSQTSIVIQDDRFKMVLANGGIFKKRVVGSIGAIGSHTSGITTTYVAEPYSDSETGLVSTYARPVVHHYYRRQITQTLYDEIQVADLRMSYYIYDGLFTTGLGTDAILMIPVDRSITHAYSVPDREQLYARSLHYIFNSRTEVTIAWYQQAWFSFILNVVAVAVIVVSLGSATGPAATLLSAIAAGTTAAITSAILVILEKLLIGALLGMAFKLFAKVVGVDIAIILAVVAAAYGMYQAIDNGSITGAPWAQELLQVSSGLTKGIASELKDLYGELLGEYQSFNLFRDEATKQLEAANKLLEHNNWLNPFVIFGEKPDDYYNRTVHSGNVGVLGIGAISNYVDIALTLPKLDETIEG